MNFSGNAKTAPGYLEALDGSLCVQFLVAACGGFGIESFTFFAVTTMLVLFEWYLIVQIKNFIIDNKKQIAPVEIPVALPQVEPTQQAA